MDGWKGGYTRSSLTPNTVLLIRENIGLKMHPSGFTAFEKAVCKSRPGNLLSIVLGVSGNTKIWIVHECNFHVKANWISILVTVSPNPVSYIYIATTLQ